MNLKYEVINAIIIRSNSKRVSPKSSLFKNHGIPEGRPVPHSFSHKWVGSRPFCSSECLGGRVMSGHKPAETNSFNSLLGPMAGFEPTSPQTAHLMLMHYHRPLAQSQSNSADVGDTRIRSTGRRISFQSHRRNECPQFQKRERTGGPALNCNHAIRDRHPDTRSLACHTCRRNSPAILSNVTDARKYSSVPGATAEPSSLA